MRMSISWRQAKRGAVALVAVLLNAPAPGHAQAWKPEKPGEIIMGTSPGGPQDRTGGTIQKILPEQKLVQTEEWKKDLARLEMENVYRNSADTARYWKLQHDAVRAVLTDLGLAR